VTAAVGFVVAGGRSARMGRDKALLPWGPGTLLDHALARLRSVCTDVRVLCGALPRYADRGARLVPDRVADAGPLAGLEAALASLDGGRALLLGVDMPFTTTAVLEALVGWADAFEAAVPVVGGRPEPLCAVYARECLPAVRESLAAGERRMTAFWDAVRVRQVPEDELAAYGDPRRLFLSVNRPEEYEEVVPR
jgi:molybdopterin-guanine dinucleotide biosynthesis protein A